MYNPDYNFWGYQQGWVCPKCGRTYSPSTPMCFYCNNNQTVWTIPNTTSVPSHPQYPIITCEKSCEECEKHETTCFNGVEITTNHITSHVKPPEVTFSITVIEI